MQLPCTLREEGWARSGPPEVTEVRLRHWTKSVHRHFSELRATCFHPGLGYKLSSPLQGPVTVSQVLQRARTNRIYVYIEREFIRENWLTRSSGEVPPQAVYKLRKQEASHVSKSESLKSWEANGQPSVCGRRPKSPQQTTGRSSGVQRPKNLESNVQGQEASTTGER